MTQKLMGTKQVAERLGRTPNLVHWLVKKERLLPAVKLPGKTGAMLFDPEVVEEFARKLDEEEQRSQSPNGKAVA